MKDTELRDVILNYARIAREFFDGAILVSSPDMIAIRDFIYRIAGENFKLKSATNYRNNQADLPCDIGDTAYCVNGYGSNRYIEKFTVDKIVISNEDIVLIDPNGAEWLARVCHFSLESAERALKAKKEFVNIINENFDKEDIIIHLTYELDKAPQSEEVRKDIENYIRRLKERRSENN